MVGALDGSVTFRKILKGKKAEAEKLGKALAKDLKKAGAKEVLDEIYKTVRLK
jgi:porphobilinogen deaminase